jgi:cytochrome c
MMAAAGVAQSQSRPQTAQELLRQYKCYICHADDETKTGPAYVDIAARYRGNPQAIAIVSGVVRKGASSGGPWHMPPHPEISSRDATTMARYILSLKR